MDRSIIRHILGRVMMIEGGLMLLPAVVGLFYGEYFDTLVYVCTAIGAFLLGLLFSFRKPATRSFYLKEGCIVTSLSWVFLSLIGALPFTITGDIPSYLDAVFETVSGFSTTGASILSDVTVLSHVNLFWRSFTNWIGGMGVLVFLLAIVSMNGGSSINLMRAESPGPTVGKLVPKIEHTAQILYILYVALSAIMFILLLIGGMPLFDSICTTFSTAGTGGFSVYNDSMGSQTIYIKTLVSIFMFLFGVNFNFYYFLLLRDGRKAFSIEEVRTYFGIVIICTLIIYFDLCRSFVFSADNLVDAFFQVTAIISTTGFSSTNFDLWGRLSITVLVILMFTGACAGSTAGGIKLSRIVLLLKTIKKEILSYIYPKSVKKIKIDGKPVEHEVQRSANVFIITYLGLFIISCLLISIEGHDFETTFSSVATTLSNVGPGLSRVGPAENYAFYLPLSKIVLIFNMLAGRLELFPVLILLHPRVWREMLHSRLADSKKA